MSNSLGRGLDISKSFEQQNGSPQYVQTMTSADSTDVVSLNLTPGTRLMVQAVEAGYFLPGGGGDSVVLSASNGVYLAQNEKFYITLRKAQYGDDDQDLYVQFVSTNASPADLKVFKME